MKLRFVFGWFVALALPQANAGIGDFFEKMFAIKNTYEFTVTDQQGKPIPNVVVWESHRGAEYPNLTLATFQRFARRYAVDADYVIDVTSSPHRWMATHYGTPDGKVIFELNNIGEHDKNLKSIHTFLVVVKRGYQPVVLEDDSANRRRKFEVQLTPNDEAVNPLMLEFDQYRAEAQNSRQLGMMAPERVQLLSQLQTKLRNIAQQLEQQNQPDLAARVYYNLAYLPSVDFFRDNQGNLLGSGFTNGYEARVPQRYADYTKAMELNQSVPYMRWNRLDEIYEDQGEWRGPNNAIRTEKFLAESLAIKQQHGERLWPYFYQRLFDVYSSTGRHDEACAMLKELYQFEPDYKSPKGWAREQISYESGQSFNVNGKAFDPAFIPKRCLLSPEIDQIELYPRQKEATQ